jgi:2-polyprenyl-3-methyl-5-hydroxy-6-metoxy-1,4-benzoquinol methylase
MKPNGNQLIVRGGATTERLFTCDDEFVLPSGSRVIVRKSDMPNAKLGMQDVFARGLARYGAVALYCRPGKSLLDVPAGCGYSAPFLRQFGVTYLGIDVDEPTVEFARRNFGGSGIAFEVGDMREPDFGEGCFDIIGCIEGIEHISQEFQAPLIRALRRCLKPNGVMIVSSPEPVTKISGPSDHNPDHLWELCEPDFIALLREAFGAPNVELLSQRNVVLSTGATTRCLFGICHRE